MIRQAAIFCSSIGTPPGALTTQKPRCLLDVGGAPFLDLLLFELGRHGIRHVLLLSGCAAQQISDYAASTPLKARFGLQIDVVDDPQRGGTGDAPWHVRDWFDDVFFVLNSDSWFEVNLLELAVRLAEKPSAGAAVALRRQTAGARFGVMEIHGGVYYVAAT